MEPFTQGPTSRKKKYSFFLRIINVLFGVQFLILASHITNVDEDIPPSSMNLQRTQQLWLFLESAVKGS